MGAIIGQLIIYFFAFGIPAILVYLTLENIIKARKAKSEGKSAKKYIIFAIIFLILLICLVGFYGYLRYSLSKAISSM